MNKLSYEELEKRISHLEKAETKYKRINETLLESENLYRQAIDNADAVAYKRDFETDSFSFIGKGIFKLTGYQPEEITHDIWQELVKEYVMTGKCSGLTEGEAVALNRNGDLKEWHADFRIVGKDGIERWLSDSSVRVVDEEGIPIASMGIIQDITERKRAEEALKASEKKYHDLNDSLPITIFESDRNGLLTYVNEFALKLFGYTRSKFMSGLNVLEMIAPTERARALENYTRTLQGEIEYSKEYMAVKKDGTEFPVVIQTKRILDNDESIGMRGYLIDVTERKIAEEEIFKSREKYKSLFDQAGDAIFLIDEDGYYLDVNRKSTELLGYSREELIGTSYKKYITNDSLSNSQNNFRLLKNDESLPTYERSIVNKKGEIIPTEITLSTVKDNNNNILYIQSMLRDISERKELEKVQSALFTISSSRTDSLDELLALCHKEISKLMDARNFYVAFIEDREKSIYRLSYFVDEKEKDITLDIPINLCGGLTDYVAKSEKPLLATEKSIIKLEKQGKLKKIGPRSKSYMASLLYGAKNLIGIIGIQSYHDTHAYSEKHHTILNFVSEHIAMVIERKQAEEALRKEQQLSRVLIDSIPFSITIKDVNGKILIANQTAIGQFKKTDETEVIGKTDFDLISRQLASEHFIDEQEILRTNKAILNKVVFSEDNKKWGLVSKIPIKYTEDDSTILISIVIDITEQREAENERKELEGQLLQSQKMESIGRLAGGVAHDFNNILAGIMGYAELLSLKFDSKHSIEGKATEVILKGAERAAKLTQQLLGFARSGKYEQKPANINSIIEEVISVSEKIFEKQINLKCDFQENISTVFADKNQLDQVFTNIFINAKDALPGGGMIYIKTEDTVITADNARLKYELFEGKYVRISIKDNGIGMSKEISSKIFEPFFTTKSEGKGTGLGLASVYGIINNHNGNIYCESAPGEGTTFTIYLPTCDKIISEEESVLKVETGNSTILVVDDEASVLSMVKEILEHLQYTILTAKDGNEAIELYNDKKEKIDLVVLDMIMPGKTGKETFIELKKISPEVKVILASGYSKDGQASDLLKKGVTGFIQKPFRMQEISRVIAEALKKE